MGNSVSRYVNAVKTVKPQKFTLHQLSFFSSLQRSQTLPSCFLRLHTSLLRSRIFLSHLDIISFQNHTHISYLFPPLTFLYLFVSFFFVLLQTWEDHSSPWCNDTKLLVLVQMLMRFHPFWQCLICGTFFVRKGEKKNTCFGVLSALKGKSKRK